ncbi:TolC family outer membrane protein [Rhodoblastus sp.]|uniref:TolC family outer membrane protein n=1 Tax=Rhodoblastus sp. TaxID=1962975 RepID=UPI003F9BFA3D
MRFFSKLGWALGVSALAASGASFPASAETMSGALSRAYSNNPDINQQRAAVRARDEQVPTAKAGWLPHASGNLNAGRQVSEISNLFGQGGNTKYGAFPRGSGAQVTETVFDGMRTANSVGQAESSVLQARETMRETEITTLQAGATAYMDVLRDTAVLGLRANNIKVLEVQLQQTRDRFQVGEVTRTDVAQAESSLATGRADYAVAQSQLETSVANYRRQIGVPPKQLQPAQPIEKLLARTVDSAILTGLEENPTILGALHQVDAAQAAVKVAEGALLPTATVQGQVLQTNDTSGFPNYNQWSVSVVGAINVPLYQGGAEYAGVRQAKETLGQARLAVDSQRIAVRAAVASAWGQLQAARAQIISFQAAVRASEVALNGVREEAKVGQRTTLDVLNAQQTLLNSRVQLVTAQHDRVVASYAVMAAEGRLTAEGLGLGVVAYNPDIHYQQTKNRFIGLDTPDGR